MTQSPICIYHANCLDGFTAAWAVWRKHPHSEFVAASYGDAPPDVTGRDVFIVDFSYKRDVLLAMAKSARSILILDHHKTAAAELVDLPANVEAVFDMHKSGAHLAWEWFHPRTPPSLLVEHVEDRDLWRFEIPNTAEFNAYLFSLDFEFETWEDIADRVRDADDYDLMIDIGAALERKHDKDARAIINAGTYLSRIDGYEVPCVNAPPMFASKIGHILSADYEFAATYYDTRDHRIYSLRSSERGLDVSEIAKKYGGGGHKHAAGFKIPLNPVYGL